MPAIAAERIVPPALEAPPATASFAQMVGKIIDNPLAMYSEDYFHVPMKHSQSMGKKIVHVMSPELVEEVMQSEDFGRSEILLDRMQPIIGEGLLLAEGRKWRNQRKAASPAFRAKALEALIPTFDNVGLALAQRLLANDRDEVDVYPQTVRATVEVIAQTLLSDEAGMVSVEEIERDVNAIVEGGGKVTKVSLLPLVSGMLPKSITNPGMAKALAAADRTRALASSIIEQRSKREDPGSDLLGLLLKAKDEHGDGLSREELLDNILTFIFAGHETTAILLAWALVVLSKSEFWQEELANEAAEILPHGPLTSEALKRLDKHERFIKEVLRLYPPAALIPRRVVNPTRLGYLDLDPGDAVVVGVYPLHRHHMLWDDPEVFDPDRFLPGHCKEMHRYQWIPFGAGPRICIGMRMSMMEAVAILVRLTSQVRFSPPDSVDPVPTLTVTLRPSGKVPLRVAPW